MNIMTRWAVVLLRCSSCGIPSAGQATGEVVRIAVADNFSSVLFSQGATITETPRCNERQKFSVGLEKLGGMAAYMLLLDAKRQGHRLAVEGLRAWANGWKSDDIKRIAVK